MSFRSPLVWHGHQRTKKVNQSCSFCDLLPAGGSPCALYQTELMICIQAQHQMIAVNNSLCRQCFTARAVRFLFFLLFFFNPQEVIEQHP